MVTVETQEILAGILVAPIPWLVIMIVQQIISTILVFIQVVTTLLLVTSTPLQVAMMGHALFQVVMILQRAITIAAQVAMMGLAFFRDV
jgi:hypothetical protein